MNATDKLNKHDLGPVVVNYIGFKIRFVKLFGWQLNVCNNKTDRYVELCKFLSDSITTIGKIVDGKFRDGDIHEASGKFGDFIEYPELTFELPKSKVKVTCHIRINPCPTDSEKDGYQHQSKIWANLKNESPFKIDGKSIGAMLVEAREICTDISNTVGNYYLSSISRVTGQAVPDIDRSYWASLESVLMAQDIPEEKGLESLFYSGDKDDFLRLFKNSPYAQRAMADVVEWTYDKKIEDPLKFKKNNKDKDAKWKVGRSPDARIFYIRRNTDNFYHIVGVGESLSTELDVSFVDNILLPGVAGLIATL